MIWLIRKIKNKLVMMQKYKYAGYLLDLERYFKSLRNKRKESYQGFPGINI